MGVFVSVAIMVSVLSLMIFQLVKNVRYGAAADEKARVVPWLLMADVLLFGIDVMLGSDVGVRLMLDLSLALNPLMILNSSLWSFGQARRLVIVFTVIEALPAFYYLSCLFGITRIAASEVFLDLAVLGSLVQSVVFICAIWLRIYDIRSVMKSGTVWSSICLSVETIYAVCALMIMLACHSFCIMSDSVSGFHIHMAVFLLGAEVIALGLRIFFDSAFVLLHRHERIIVESMKISQMEALNSNTRMNDLYKDVYERILLHFEMDRPFLNSELTINDIVKVVFTNKLYISRAISHYTGRNFCQFVNYYRVMHSMDMFRQKPELKVSELANICGFNSVVSFSSAFRLFMNETPSEWCRKERISILKKKK